VLFIVHNTNAWRLVAENTK